MLRALPLSQIKVTDPFWVRWQKVVFDVTLPMQYDQCVKTGRIENFWRASRKESGTHQGRVFNDSDVYKWIEAANYALSVFGSSPELEKLLDEAIDAICAAQEADGYINTFIQVNRPDMKYRNLTNWHEMYCMGHLIEAACAHDEAIGNSKLHDAAIRLAHHLWQEFGPGKRDGFCGHEELELALLKLAKTAKEPRFAELARHMIEQRGQRPSIFETEIRSDPEVLKVSPHCWGMNFDEAGNYHGEYLQDHHPVRATTTAVGHAVRAMYLYAAATEAFHDDEEMQASLRAIWQHLVERQMYITGGIGDKGSIEGFSKTGKMGNQTAYAETCASVGAALWAQRWVHITGTADAADVLEKELYNGALAGISLTGDRFFYENPLESMGDRVRQPWYDCACCPPNIARLILSLGSFLCAVDGDSFSILIPCAFEAEWSGCRIIVTGDYAASGTTAVTIKTLEPKNFKLRIRIPEWSDEMSAEFPDEWGEMDYAGGFAEIERTWTDGDTISFDFGIKSKFMIAPAAFLDCAGKTAVQRGPVIYCAEGIDQAFPPQQFLADPLSEIEEAESLIPGLDVPGLVVSGAREIPPAISSYESYESSDFEAAELKMIPYFAWANRAPSPMQVWLRVMEQD